MRKISGSSLWCLFICACAFVLWGCLKDKVTRTYTIQRPVMKANSAVLAEINGSAAEPVQAAGKIYIRGKYIFVNEINKGIHVIDNSDPVHPIQTAFLKIPGNLDIAVKDNILYADMYASLLAIDISDLHHVSVTKMLPNFFTNRQYYVNGYYADSSQVIVGWIKKDTTVTVGDEFLSYANNCAGCSFALTSDTKAASSTGVAGSMAAMVLINNYLYAITEPHSVGIINISNSAMPSKAGSMYAGFDLQTIYPFKDKLFLGSATGMFMLDVGDPVHPVSIGQFAHGRACDPVVSDGNYAYVTLHAGTSCGGASNELDVIDVLDMKKANLVKTYPLTKPTGLCKDGNLLFVCDGSDGVKLFDATDPANLRLLQQIKNDDPYDVIATNNYAMVIGKSGLYQYDYSDVNHIKMLSAFSLKQ